jgi:non-canonical poly(A) RNA polymerase PAPD5/7
MWPNATLHSFGSYAYGIYLPTADMDLCFVSHRFRDTGRPEFEVKRNAKLLYKFMNCLDRAGIPSSYDKQVIASARVPIIKFVDQKTGLKVDISFENLGGVNALSTFNAWKATYPALPVLVSMIKQFLLMRDLSEVHTGGLGGFSVACLIVSMLQLSPEVQSENIRNELDFGALLLRFFDLYGNRFNMTDHMISLDPPGYLVKAS